MDALTVNHAKSRATKRMALGRVQLQRWLDATERQCICSGDYKVIPTPPRTPLRRPGILGPIRASRRARCVELTRPAPMPIGITAKVCVCSSYFYQPSLGDFGHDTVTRPASAPRHGRPTTLCPLQAAAARQVLTAKSKATANPS